MKFENRRAALGPELSAGPDIEASGPAAGPPIYPPTFPQAAKAAVTKWRRAEH
jgi:hypothetical protein